MAYPRKFQSLLEVTLRSVEKPDYVYLTYAVCARENDSCGWGGWILEGAFKDDPTLQEWERALPGERCS